MTLAAIFELLALLVLAASVPVSYVAFQGFRGAPFGRVLRPIPFVLVGYIGYLAPQYLPMDIPLLYYAGVSTVGVLAALVAASEAALLLTGRRAV